MPVKALQEIEKHIADTRRLIENQSRLIRRLRDGGHDEQDIVSADDLLKTLRESLEALKERRKVMLREIRQPLATSRPPAENGPSFRARVAQQSGE